MFLKCCPSSSWTDLVLRKDHGPTCCSRTANSHSNNNLHVFELLSVEQWTSVERPRTPEFNLRLAAQGQLTAIQTTTTSRDDFNLRLAAQGQLTAIKQQLQPVFLKCCPSSNHNLCFEMLSVEQLGDFRRWHQGQLTALFFFKQKTMLSVVSPLSSIADCIRRSSKPPSFTYGHPTKCRPAFESLTLDTCLTDNKASPQHHTRRSRG
jgi:hypothetical protein